jgi:SpoIID/LytB domain protein
VTALIPAYPAAPAIPTVVVSGKGFGHGVGMPQDGAAAMSRAKANLAQILGRFYPGTHDARASGRVRVRVADAGAPTGRFTVAFPSGGDITDGRASRLKVGRGGEVALSFDGTRYHADTLATGSALRRDHIMLIAVRGQTAPTPTTATGPTLPLPTASTAPAPTTTTSTAVPRSPAVTRGPAPPAMAAESEQPLWAVPAGGATLVLPARQREYRGTIEALAQLGGFRLVNEIDVEEYLRGMGEVRDPSWPEAGLMAQAIAARTYALRAASVGGRPEGFDLFDDQRSQVYLGRQAEYKAMDRAVSKTAGKVLTFDGRLAATVYSASAGGVTATPPEGFGPLAPDRPYLPAVRYDTPDPRAWRVEFALSDVAARASYPGLPTVVAVSKHGPSGRALEIMFEGSAGTRTMSGVEFARGLGLHSTLFDVGLSAADAPPPPPPTAAGFVQELPEGGPVAPDAAPPATGAALTEVLGVSRALEREPIRVKLIGPPRGRGGPIAVASIALVAVGWILVAQRLGLIGALARRGRPRGAPVSRLRWKAKQRRGG